jgi:hypothetical protein
LNAPIKHKTKTTAEWVAANTRLLRGQIGVEVNAGSGAVIRIAIGDGNTAWNDRAAEDFFYPGSGGGGGGGAVGPTGPPSIGKAPIVYWQDDKWLFFLELPSDNGRYATNVEIRLQNADVGFSKIIPLGIATFFEHPRLPFDVDADYRWRNSYRTGSDGWSDWSLTSTAYADTSALENPPYSEFVTYDADPNDGSLL